MQTLRIVTATLCLLLAACDDGEENFEPALGGVWSNCADGNATYVFGADGAFAFDSTASADAEESHWIGTFTADATTYLADATSPSDSTLLWSTSYHLAADGRLFMSVMHPEDDHDGVVGTWHRLVDSRVNGVPSGQEREIELRDDGTGVMTTRYFDGTPEDVATGTFVAGVNEGSYLYHYEIPGDGFVIEGDIAIELLDDAVLVLGTGPGFCRQP
jgi:hypothetical protein